MASSPIRVLVADDYHDSGEVLGELLRMSGCQVVVTRTGEQAIEAAKTLKPQLVIIDLHMPGMDGFDTIAALKLQPDADSAVYVAHSGNDHPPLIAKVRQAGFQHFVLKTRGYERFEEILSTIPVPPKRWPSVAAVITRFRAPR
jgi:CheY-like chemotaxis protein